MSEETASEKPALKKRSSLGKVPKETPSSTVLEETSRQLTEELDKNSRPHYDFRSTARSGSVKAIREDFQQIVDKVWVNDLHEQWVRIRKSLRVGERRSEHGYLQRSLDEARKLSYDAHRLYVTAKLELERWERENEVVFGAMWNDANRVLQVDKANGSRSKQITDADVRATCATLFPDEWKAQENKRHAYKLTVDNMGQLSKDANEHCEDLRVMLAKLRG